MYSFKFKAGLLSALTALILSGSGCRSESTAGIARTGSAIVMSRDDSAIYVADTDNNQVIVVDRESRRAIRTITVGHSPERIVVGSDGRLFVSNRMNRTVSVVDPNAGRELIRIPVGTEPTGLAISEDGQTLAVANATNNTVSIIDTRALAVTKTIETDVDPHGVAFLPNGVLYVTHQRAGAASVVDLSTGQKTKTIPFSLAPEKTAGEQRLAAVPADPVVGTDGRVYVPTVQTKEDPTPTVTGTPGGGYAGGGTPGSVPVVASGITTIDTGSHVVIPGAGIDKSGCLACDATARKVPPSVLTTIQGLPFSGPSAAAIEPSGRFLYMTNLHSNNVAILATDGSMPKTAGDAVPGGFFGQGSNGIIALVKVGAGPKGIAISSSGDRAYVYNSFDETISVLAPGDKGVVLEATFAIATVPLTPEQQLGRKLFFAADDTRMTNTGSGGISCASCHPGGREDGRTWKFSEGPRNTPSLAGRGLSRTAPFHWDGLLEDIHDFKMVVEERMGGTGMDASSFNAMLAYLDSLPGADNPFLTLEGTPVNAEAVARGQAVFEGKAQCATCHTGPDFTDNGFHNVGTQVNLALNGTPEFFPNNVNTPPLHGLFRTGPYLHDGSVATLRDRLEARTNPNDLHGVTSTLTEQERGDLLEYLQTL